MSKRLVLLAVELLYIDSVFAGMALQYRRLVKLLASAELLYDTCLFKFSLKLLEGAFDVLAFLYGYYDHFLMLCFIL